MGPKRIFPDRHPFIATAIILAVIFFIMYLLARGHQYPVHIFYEDDCDRTIAGQMITTTCKRTEFTRPAGPTGPQ